MLVLLVTVVEETTRGVFESVLEVRFVIILLGGVLGEGVREGKAEGCNAFQYQRYKRESEKARNRESEKARKREARSDSRKRKRKVVRYTLI